MHTKDVTTTEGNHACPTQSVIHFLMCCFIVANSCMQLRFVSLQKVQPNIQKSEQPLQSFLKSSTHLVLLLCALLCSSMFMVSSLHICFIKSINPCMFHHLSDCFHLDGKTPQTAEMLCWQLCESRLVSAFAKLTEEM